jgi:hypothetical protein
VPFRSPFFDPFFGMDSFVSPFFEPSSPLQSMARTARGVPIDIVEVCFCIFSPVLFSPGIVVSTMRNIPSDKPDARVTSSRLL